MDMLTFLAEPTVAAGLFGAITAGVVGFWAWARERTKSEAAVQQAQKTTDAHLHSEVARAMQDALAVYTTTLRHTRDEIGALREEIEDLNTHIAALLEKLSDHGIQAPPRPPRRRRPVTGEPLGAEQQEA